MITDEVITTKICAVPVGIDKELLYDELFYFVGTNSLSAFSSFSRGDISYNENYDESFLKGNEPLCIMREKVMKERNISLGDELEIDAYETEYSVEGWETIKYKKIGTTKIKVIGSYRTGDMRTTGEIPDIISSMRFVENIYEGANIKFYASSASFALKNSLKINEFKNEMQNIGFLPIDMQAGFSRAGKALIINDETFIMSATQLTKSLNMLKSFAPLIFIIIIVIGFISSYLLMQSRQNEFAIMRSLGTSERKCFIIILLESIALVLLGSISGIFISQFVVNIKVKSIELILPVFIVFYVLGTVVALLLLNRFSVITILSKTD